MRWRALQERGIVRSCPNFLGATTTAIQPPTALAWVRSDQTAIKTPRQHAGQNCPCIVRLPAPGTSGKLVAPFHENATSAAVGQGRKREVTETLFDARNQRHIATPSAAREPAEVLAALIGIQHAQKRAARRCDLP